MNFTRPTEKDGRVGNTRRRSHNVPKAERPPAEHLRYSTHTQVPTHLVVCCSAPVSRTIHQKKARASLRKRSCDYTRERWQRHRGKRKRIREKNANPTPRGSLALRPCSRVILASVASRWRYRYAENIVRIH